MTMTEKLALLAEMERRNSERIKAQKGERA